MAEHAVREMRVALPDPGSGLARWAKVRMMGQRPEVWEERLLDAEVPVQVFLDSVLSLTSDLRGAKVSYLSATYTSEARIGVVGWRNATKTESAVAQAQIDAPMSDAGAAR